MFNRGAWEQPPRGATGYQVLSDILFRLGLIANSTHTVQYLVATWIVVAIIITCFGTVWPFWCWCAVKLWYHHHQCLIASNIAISLLHCAEKAMLACSFSGRHITFQVVKYMWRLVLKSLFGHTPNPCFRACLSTCKENGTLNDFKKEKPKYWQLVKNSFCHKNNSLVLVHKT